MQQDTEAERAANRLKRLGTFQSGVMVDGFDEGHPALTKVESKISNKFLKLAKGDSKISVGQIPQKVSSNELLKK